MKRSTVNRRGFSLVELMVTIAIIAILAAVAVPAYSNYVLRAKFQDEIGKMDNYRKAIAIFIQESGITSDEQFQTDIVNVKDNYFGDDNVAIMSELKSNNGRLLAHPVINGTTYQIAITPRINDNGSLINWECDIRNDTDNSTPPTGASMPNGCNVAADDLNDDQVAYIQEFNDNLVGTRNAALTSASNTLSDEYNDLVNADKLSSEEGSLGDLNDKIATTNTLIQAEIDKIIANRDVLDDFFDIRVLQNFNTNYDNALSNLNANDNGVSNLQTELSSLESQKNDYIGKVTDQDYVDILNNISSKESEIITAQSGQGLTELTAYRDNITDTSSTEYTNANVAVANKTTEISNLTTAKNNYDNAQTERDVQNDLIINSTSGYNTQITNRQGVLNTNAKDANIYNGTTYDQNTENINQTFNTDLEQLNSSNSQDHIDKATGASVALDSTTSSVDISTT